MSTPARTVRRTTRTALPLGLALLGALALSPALAQDAASDDPAGAAAHAAPLDAAPRAGAFSMRRGPDGGFTIRGTRVDPRAGGPRGANGGRPGAAAGHWRARLHGDAGVARGDAFVRWLAADLDAGPVVPGLVGRVADGTTVRIAFYAGTPEDGGTPLAERTYVAGEGDAAAFRDEVRTLADGATHVVVDVLGRVVALPRAQPEADAE